MDTQNTPASPHRPRLTKRQLAALALAGLTGLSAAGAVVVSTCTLCYAVSPSGGAPVAYVRQTEAYQQAVCQVEEQVSEILHAEYAYPENTQVALAIAPREQVQTPDQLTVSLMETVEQVREAAVLCVDGVSVGACATQEEIWTALDLVKTRSFGETTYSVAILNHLDVVQDYLPAADPLLTAEELARLLLGQPEPGEDGSVPALAASPAPLLTVETVEEDVYTQPIEPEVQEQEDPTRILGERATIQEGTPGEELRTDRVVRQNGQETGRETLSSQILTDPTPTIVAVGTATGVDAAQGRFLTPTQGRLTSPFGPRYIFGSTSFHNGVDLANATGTPILASAGGTVTWAGPKGTYGNLVKVDHGNGFVTYYAHCSQLLVGQGDWVEQGETIALMGSTGRSTGPHLHFEVRWLDEPLDPLLCLPS